MTNNNNKFSIYKYSTVYKIIIFIKLCNNINKYLFYLVINTMF